MDAAINFDNEFFLGTVEIDNVWSNRYLSSEFSVVKTTRSELPLEEFFHGRLLCAEDPGERESFWQTLGGSCGTH